MPIKIQGDLPVKEILERENIFVMDEGRAVHQDIRPIQILILNLMPLKEETELQLLRSLSNTPLQVDVTFMAVESHEARNTSISHLNKFYETFSDLKDRRFDGMIITGAPVEQMEFEEVDYWNELQEIMDWTSAHVTSTIFLCWAAQASLYHFYGLKKRQLDHKMFGLFWHKVLNRKIPLVRGFDDVFLAPESMTEAVKEFCRETKQQVPETTAQLAAVIYNSLAVCYKDTVKEIEQLTGVSYECIHVVGGGANAQYLNELTAKQTGRTVYAGPTEATAIGNLTVQMLAAGKLSDLTQARKTIFDSFDIKTYQPV